MKTILKNIITYGLSLLVVATIIHIDHHVDEYQDGYSICGISCDDEKHHSISHKCEKCLNKNNRLIIQECIDLSYNGYTTSFYSLNESFKYSFLHFSLYSRPPPQVSVS